MNLKDTIFQKNPPAILDKRLKAIDAMFEQVKLAVGLVARLRGPNGCPWDREQNHLSLRPYLIEEAHEVLEVLDRYESRQNPKELAKAAASTAEVPADGSFSKEDVILLKEELGDLLLQVVLHSQLAWERGDFHFGDVSEFMAQKLVTRHPHVFGETKVDGAESVLTNWEIIKKQEKEKKGKVVKIDVPRGLPSLQRAERISDKAARLGFDWRRIEDVMKKVEEELGELKEAMDSKDLEHIEHEMGDLFFASCQLSRWLKIHPEDAHRKAVSRFENRFSKVEEYMKNKNIDMTKATEEELEDAWNWAKTQTK